MLTGMDLTLRPLTVADEAAARAAHTELAADDFLFLLEDAAGTWSAYIHRLAQVSRGEGLAPDRVPATLLVADVGGDLVGRVSVRHELNDWLSSFGGHIGYGVRPAYRRRGYATEILRQALGYARGVGVTSALVTCDADNVGSWTVIERCGGVFERLAPGPPGHGPIRRYWVPTG